VLPLFLYTYSWPSAVLLVLSRPMYILLAFGCVVRTSSGTTVALVDCEMAGGLSWGKHAWVFQILETLYPHVFTTMPLQPFTSPLVIVQPSTTTSQV
jgi:hypothetical protein